MKKIINGKKYDTETAKEVGFYSNGYPGGNFYWCEEILYRKKTGEYFLHGKGGALTCYAESVWNGTISGTKIIPMSEDEAREWAEKKLNCDEYEKLFGEVEE